MESVPLVENDRKVVRFFLLVTFLPSPTEVVHHAEKPSCVFVDIGRLDGPPVMFLLDDLLLRSSLALSAWVVVVVGFGMFALPPRRSSYRLGRLADITAVYLGSVLSASNTGSPRNWAAVYPSRAAASIRLNALLRSPSTTWEVAAIVR